MTQNQTKKSEIRQLAEVWHVWGQLAYAPELPAYACNYN